MNGLSQFSLACAVLVLAGCSSGGSGGPAKFVPLSGTVKLDGKAYSGVTISLIPDTKITKDAGAGGLGFTDADGKYVMKYRGEKDGIPPGTYKAVFSLLVLPDGKPVPPGTSAADAGAVEGISRRYSDPTESATMVVVGDAGGTQDFDLKGALKKGS